MISIATTSTGSPETVAGPIEIIGIIILLSLLVQKELLSTSDSQWAARLNKILNIGIAPLLIAFVLIVASKVVDALK